ncbi:uncharacterized protein LOC107876589 [Capsicum annuum]|uniref:uncharacterized protein LOC107876589 n=1 Tax=Capsicum annuum TaxID=4072 RepID=UPI0007BFE71D|nr:uncharacterized protein LOC107876589 [Capsicum annuum]
MTRQCVIKFKVGNYKDKVCCDVIPMQACYLLLGIPWQYDKANKHDWRLKKYSLEHGGKNFTLHPLSPSQVTELHQILRELKEKGKTRQEYESVQKGEVLDSITSKGGASGSKDQKGQGAVVMLDRRKELFKDEDTDTPMLRLEFDDVFPQELPKRFPPIWGIENQIDLV